MISHEAFGKLRLSQFVAPDEITHIDNWEFMDRIWVGEVIGFSEWLRLKSDPSILRSLSLDLAELPSRVSSAVLQCLGLPLARGMRLADIEERLGRPTKRERFVEDRYSYCFVHGTERAYELSCTVHESEGLIYIVVMTPLPTEKGDGD